MSTTIAPTCPEALPNNSSIAIESSVTVLANAGGLAPHFRVQVSDQALGWRLVQSCRSEEEARRCLLVVRSLGRKARIVHYRIGTC